MNTNLAVTGAKEALTRFVGKQALRIKKYSPEILIGVGIVSIVGGVVSACAATLKAEEVIQEAKDNKAKIEQAHDLGLESYTEEDYKKDMMLSKVKFVGGMAKLYAPSVFLIGGGIACFLGSYGILKSRNAALVTAYNTLYKGFEEYRQRVRDDLGEEKDREYRYGYKTETTEDGETVKTLKEGYTPSIYARYFDACSMEYQNDAFMNRSFITGTQNWANDQLRTYGYIFLNDVYDRLDLPKCRDGWEVGWVWKGPNTPPIDFGVFDVRRESSRDFVNGYEKAILLDFHVDGVITDIVFGKDMQNKEKVRREMIAKFKNGITG